MYSVYDCVFLKVCNKISWGDKIRVEVPFERQCFDLLFGM